MVMTCLWLFFPAMLNVYVVYCIVRLRLQEWNERKLEASKVTAEEGMRGSGDKKNKQI
jgi:hypothetical protein